VFVFSWRLHYLLVFSCAHVLVRVSFSFFLKQFFLLTFIFALQCKSFRLQFIQLYMPLVWLLFIILYLSIMLHWCIDVCIQPHIRDIIRAILSR
jgi:hypothetical protein